MTHPSRVFVPLVLNEQAGGVAHPAFFRTDEKIHRFYGRSIGSTYYGLVEESAQVSVGAEFNALELTTTQEALDKGFIKPTDRVLDIRVDSLHLGDQDQFMSWEHFTCSQEGNGDELKTTVCTKANGDLIVLVNTKTGEVKSTVTKKGGILGYKLLVRRG